MYQENKVVCNNDVLMLLICSEVTDKELYVQQ